MGWLFYGHYIIVCGSRRASAAQYRVDRSTKPRRGFTWPMVAMGTGGLVYISYHITCHTHEADRLTVHCRLGCRHGACVTFSRIIPGALKPHTYKVVDSRVTLYLGVQASCLMPCEHFTISPVIPNKEWTSRATVSTYRESPNYFSWMTHADRVHESPVLCTELGDALHA